MPRELMAVRIEPELREAVDEAAARRGLNRSALVREALEGVVDSVVLGDARDRRAIQAIREGLADDEKRLAAIQERLIGGDPLRLPPPPPWASGSA
jgi:predicted transcriptional regulator